MSFHTNFNDVEVGDRIKVSRGRSRDQISKVYHVTPKQFKVEGYGSFWKKNGTGVGDSTSWYGRYAERVEHGDAARIDRANRRVRNTNLYSEHPVRYFNDDELAKVAAVIKSCNARRNEEAEQYANEQAAAEAAAQ